MTAVADPEATAALVRRMLAETATIAVIGASPHRWRAAHEVMAFMQARGYRTLPVNPLAAGQLIHGEAVRARLADIDMPVQLVDVFRRSEAAGEAIDATIAEKDRLGIRFIWLQPGIETPAAVRRAEAAGLAVVTDRCIKVDYMQAFGAAPRSRITAG